jgi:hypothetical protein
LLHMQYLVIAQILRTNRQWRWGSIDFVIRE